MLRWPVNLESLLGTDPSQYMEEESPAPTLTSFSTWSGFLDRTTRHIARVGQVCGLGLPGFEVCWGRALSHHGLTRPPGMGSAPGGG